LPDGDGGRNRYGSRWRCARDLRIGEVLRVRDGEVATQDAAKMVTRGVGDMKAIDSYQYAGSMTPKRRRGQKGR